MIAWKAPLAGGLLLLLVLTRAAGASLLCDPFQKRLSHTILVAQFAAPIGPRSSLMSPPADLPTLVRKPKESKAISVDHFVVIQKVAGALAGCGAFAVSAGLGAFAGSLLVIALEQMLSRSERERRSDAAQKEALELVRQEMLDIMKHLEDDVHALRIQMQQLRLSGAEQSQALQAQSQALQAQATAQHGVDRPPNY